MLSQFHVYDHRLGLHEGRFIEDCPSCNPEVESFTAATPTPTTDVGITYFGFETPVSPRIGDVWHEPGAGLWVWVRRDQGELWVNALDTERVKPDTQVAIPLDQPPNPAVEVVQMTKTISDELLASKALGVDVLKEAQVQGFAQIEMDLFNRSFIRVTDFQTEHFDEPSRGFVRVKTWCYARPRPDFAPRIAS